MKKYYFIVFFLMTLFFLPKTVFAETVSGTATIGRQSILDTSNNYYYTDWKSLSTNSLNSIPVGSIYSGDSFYLMGSEYSYAISLTGQTNFAITVRVPVSANTIYTYQETDGLSQSDFSVGISPNFGVYNITPTITSFNRAKGVYARNGVAHVYMYYDVVFNFTLSEPLTGAYNLNFSVMNLTANRSAYLLTGGNSGVALEFPVGYFSGQTEPDAVLFSMMSPTVSMSYGTTADNQDIIDANNENTELIISNHNENTQDIIDSIDENYEKLVDSQEVCVDRVSTTALSFDIVGRINGSGDLVDTSSGYWRTTSNYYTKLTRITNTGSQALVVSEFDSDKNFIGNTTLNTDESKSLTSSAFYKFSSGTNVTYSLYQYYCENGNQATYDFATQPFDDNIGGTLFNGIDWYENSHFSSIITAPIAFLNSLNDSCNPVTLSYRGKDIVLPCGTTVFWERDLPYIATFRGFWNIMIGGLIIYRLGLALVMTINDCLDPTKDKVGGFDI